MARSTTRLGRVATVVPLALVSAAWTTHLAGAGPTALTSGTAVAPPAPADVVLPDGTRMPLAPVDYPASLSDPDEIIATDGRYATVVTSPDSSDIPPAALAAYQRAESVINAADPGCGLGWQLLAAIGEVESDHGRFGGAVLDAEGVAAPSIIGPVLDGRHGTAIIRDTDAGQYDGDTSYDRAVGPMQFIPSTWAVVGVDSDNDSERSPHDIDDAALAAAVYLCSGSEDLSGEAGQRVAVHRYNHSTAYVDLVLIIMNAYLEGDFDAGPGPVVSAAATGLVEPLVRVEPRYGYDDDPSEQAAAPVGPVGTPGPAGDPVGPIRGDAAAGADPVEPAEPVDPAEPVEEPTDPAEEPTGPAEEPTDPAEEPTDPAEEPADPTEEPGGGPSEGPGEQPTEPGDQPAGEPDESPAPPAEPEEGSLTADDARRYCTEVGHVDDPSVSDDAHDDCVATYTVPEQVPAAPGAPTESSLRDEATRD